MKQIKVLGSGCANCKNTAQRIETVAKEQNIAISLEKVEDIAKIMSYGVMATPAVVIDDQVVHAGGVPDKNKIMTWLVG
jgi:small redox-active disulfide protein 2